MSSKRSATRVTTYVVLCIVCMGSVLYLSIFIVKSRNSTMFIKRGPYYAMNVSKHATNGSRHATNGYKNATNGFKYAANVSKHATNGYKNATNGFRYAANVSKHASNGYKNATNGSSIPLLTVFTTWLANNYTQIDPIQNNTITNWSKFYPRAQFILFSDNNGIKKQVDKLPGWFTRNIPQSVTPRKLPVLKNMFIDVMKNFKTKYYCFINSDILFTQSFLETLEAVDSQVDNLNRPVFLTGQRWNVINITQEECSTDQTLQETVKARAKLMPTHAADYFLTNAIFPWNDMPPIAIGLAAVDGYLIDKVHTDPFIGIDATKTVLSVHQSVSKNAYLSQRKSYARYNIKLLRQMGIRTSHGKTDTLPFYTAHTWNKKDIVIMQRP